MIVNAGVGRRPRRRCSRWPLLNSETAARCELRCRVTPKATEADLLRPLGEIETVDTHLVKGVIKVLWHAPLVLMGFNYPGRPRTGIVWMRVLTTLLGIVESEWTLHHNTILRASFIHGAFNSQVYGIWRVIVPDPRPLLSGFGGLIGLGAMAVVAAWALRHRVSLVGEEAIRNADWHQGK